MAFDLTTVTKTGKQYLYTGRGPLDPKSLISTYDQLISKTTWTEGTSIIAYNGMIVAVWNNTADATKNGIYFLHDSKVTNTFKAPDVTNEANWHKLAELSNLPNISELSEQIQTLDVTVNGEDGLITKVENKADKTDLDAYYTIENADKKFATIEAVDESLSAKADKEDTYTKEEVNELQASLVEQINTVEAKIGNAKTEETVATGLFAKLEVIDDSIAEIVAATEINTAKLAGISGTVLQAIEDAVKNSPVAELEVATEEKLGGIKSGDGDNIVSVDAEGTASVNKVNVNTLTQTGGEMFVLDGGTSGVVSSN